VNNSGTISAQEAVGDLDDLGMITAWQFFHGGSGVAARPMRKCVTTESEPSFERYRAGVPLQSMQCMSILSRGCVCKGRWPTRDRIAGEEVLLCFKTKAAGLIYGLPCVVIRDIRDFADTHDNTPWHAVQRYR